MSDRLGEVEATNWRAEQAIRPAVVNRKVWGGNRTPHGAHAHAHAHAQAILSTVLVTLAQQAPTSSAGSPTHDGASDRYPSRAEGR